MIDLESLCCTTAPVRVELEFGPFKADAAQVISELGAVGLNLRPGVFVTHISLENERPACRIVNGALGAGELVSLLQQHATSHRRAWRLAELCLQLPHFEYDRVRVSRVRRGDLTVGRDPLERRMA